MTIDFDKSGGLVPAIAQDAATGQVLMLAWMNREAYDETLRTGRAVYFSRSRNKLWRKGEESGNVQEVREVYIDCDADTILLKVHQIGGAACHEGYASCFFRKVEPDGLRRRRRATSSIPSRCIANERTRPSGSASRPAACRKRPASCFARPATRLTFASRSYYPTHRRSGNPLHADPGPGDGPLRAERLARLRPDRPRLDPGKRRQGRRSWPSWSSAR